MENLRMSFCYGCSILKPTASLKLCSQCRCVYYCSSACQLAHWPSHRDRCRMSKRSHVEAETTALASPLGDAFHVESAIKFRLVINATMRHVLPLAPFPAGTKPGDIVYVWVDLKFDPTATHLCRRWRPGANLVLSLHDFVEHIKTLSIERFSSLFHCVQESTDRIKTLEKTLPERLTPWVITIFSFEDTPRKDETEDFMFLLTCGRAPCSFHEVDWVAIWWNLIETAKEESYNNFELMRAETCFLAARYFVDNPEEWKALVMAHWDSLPLGYRSNITRLIESYPHLNSQGSWSMPLVAYAWPYKWGVVQQSVESGEQAEGL